MGIVMLFGFSLIFATVSLMLKKRHPEFSFVVSISVGVFVFIAVLVKISPAIEKINKIFSSGNIPGEYAAVLFKCLGICLLARFTTDACRDAGETALGLKVELAGKAMILLTALPLFEKIMEITAKLLE